MSRFFIGAMDWLNSGRLKINNFINDTDVQMSDIKGRMRDKNTKIGMSDLGQDVKTAMTGGSVAVVGNDAVATTNLQANSATAPKRTNLGEWGSVVTGGIADINTADRTIKFNNSYTRPIYRNIRAPLDLKNKTVVIGDTTTGDSNFVYFNVQTNTLWYGAIQNAGEFDVFMGFCFWPQKFFVFNFPFTIDGSAPLATKSVASTMLTPLAFSGQLLSTQPIVVDPDTKTIAFPTATIRFNYGNASLSLAALQGTVWDLSANTANFLAFNTRTNVLEAFSDIAALTQDHVYLGYINWGGNFAIDLNANYVVKKSKGVGSLQKKWAGQDIVCFGDSITHGDDRPEYDQLSWVYQMKLMCGFWNVTNAGVSGSRVTVRPGRTNSFVERVDSIVGVKGVITVWGGINDFQFNSPLGTFRDGDTGTFYGAYEHIIKTLMQNNPDAKIICLTLMKSILNTPTYTEDGTLNVNGVGKTQVDYINAIKEICEYYAIPVLDMFAESNMNPFIDIHNQRWFHDGLHPNSAGYLRIADQIASRLELL